MLRALLLAALALAAGHASALDVLLVSTVSSPSHSIWTSALASGLLQHGHRVTELVVRPPDHPHPNRTSFVITKIYAEEIGFELESSNEYSVWKEIDFIFDFCDNSMQIALDSQAFKDLITHLREDKPHFDVLVIDYSLQEAMIGLNTLIGRRPVVAFTAYNMPEDVLTLMGSPFLPSLLPYAGVGAHGGVPMTFKERASNLFTWIAWKIQTYRIYRPSVNEVIAKAFPGAPDLDELEKDVAVALVNTSPALHGAMPLVPAVVEVGGLQARPSKPLPADILAWINEKDAPHGFVLMSFGTNVKSAAIRKDRRDAILRAFGRVKQRVLWKYEEDDILDMLPPNVRVVKWLPQNDILGHPNIRCFVSHNGGLSTQEASYHGVPLVGVPFFADQMEYAEKIEKLHLGRRVKYQEITEDSFFDALSDVIDNPKYRENMRRVRQSLRDQKEHPLERAVWWVEYAVRTAGAPDLRSPGALLRWYELYMLDVLAVVLVALLAAIWLAGYLLAVLISFVLPSSPARKTKTS